MKKGSTVEFLDEAKPRIPTQREQVLKKLREAGSEGITNIALSKVCQRWAARIHELYVEGYEVEVQNIGNGVTVYTLISEPEVKKPPVPTKKAIDLLNKAIIDNGGTITVEQLSSMLDKLDLTVGRKVGYHKRHLA